MAGAGDLPAWVPSRLAGQVDHGGMIAGVEMQDRTGTIHVDGQA